MVSGQWSVVSGQSVTAGRLYMRSVARVVQANRWAAHSANAAAVTSPFRAIGGCSIMARGPDFAEEPCSREISSRSNKCSTP